MPSSSPESAKAPLDALEEARLLMQMYCSAPDGFQVDLSALRFARALLAAHEENEKLRADLVESRRMHGELGVEIERLAAITFARSAPGKGEEDGG